MNATSWTSIILLMIGSTLPTADASDKQDEVVFNRDIRPILSNHCYACHGPDPKQRQAEFRLDIKLDAYSDRDGNRPILCATILRRANCTGGSRPVIQMRSCRRPISANRCRQPKSN